MASLSHAFGRGWFVAVKIERCNEPTDEQLAASVILTGASALRMMRAERRQMGYISWKDLDPKEECRVLRTSSPSTEDIYLPDLVWIGAASGEVQEDLCLLVGCGAAPPHPLGRELVRVFRVARRLDFRGGTGGVQSISRGPFVLPSRARSAASVFAPARELCSQDFTERPREVSASLHLACREQIGRGQRPAARCRLL